MSALILAVMIFVIGATATVLWFGVSRRREAETELGIQSLADMKWRDSVAVVMEALQRDGYSRKVDPANTGTGTEMLLAHGKDNVLLAYKHGTSYRLGNANVQEFANAVQLRGAKRGILLTLGSIEPGAAEAAESSGVELLDGRSLWQKVRQFMPPATLESVRSQASAQSRKGLTTGVASSFLVGLATYLVASLLSNTGLETSTVNTATQPVARPAVEATQTPHPADPMLEQLNAAARAMAEIAKLSGTELAKRRTQAAKEIALMPQVNTAAWSGQSRLLVTLQQSDGKDKVLIDEMCRQLTKYEELRFTRIQMEPPPGSDLPVRWHLCD